MPYGLSMVRVSTQGSKSECSSSFFKSKVLVYDVVQNHNSV